MQGTAAQILLTSSCGVLPALMLSKERVLSGQGQHDATQSKQFPPRCDHVTGILTPTHVHRSGSLPHCSIASMPSSCYREIVPPAMTTFQPLYVRAVRQSTSTTKTICLADSSGCSALWATHPPRHLQLHRSQTGITPYNQWAQQPRVIHRAQLSWAMGRVGAAQPYPLFSTQTWQPLPGTSSRLAAGPTQSERSRSSHAPPPRPHILAPNPAPQVPTRWRLLLPTMVLGLR